MSSIKHACHVTILITRAPWFCIEVNRSFGNQCEGGLSVTHVYGLKMSSLSVTLSQVDITLVINLYELRALFFHCYVGKKPNKWQTVLILM